MTFDDEITAALRRDLQAAHIGFDAAGAEDMIRVATQADPLGERRGYVAPLAAAAAVVVIGGGVATFAATRHSGTPTGGGPVAPAPCPTTSATVSAPASAIPPVYSGPASAYPTPVTTAPAPPTLVPSSTPMAPLTPPAGAPSSTAAAPETPIPTGSIPAAPTPVPSSSATTDPCAPSETPTASDLPTPVPTAVPYVDCSPRSIDPGFSGCVTFRVAAGTAAGDTTTTAVPADRYLSYRVPYVLKSYVIDNPNGDSGTVTIRQGSQTLMTRALGPATGIVTAFEPAAAAPVSRDHPVDVVVTCTNRQRSCTPIIAIGARPVQPMTPSGTPTPTHS